MKKSTKIILIVVAVFIIIALCVGGFIANNQKNPVITPTPTVETTPEPTATVTPTDMAEPTLEPTQAVTPTQALPTEEPDPTPIPTVEPTAEPTVEVTPTEVPVISTEPTEVPEVTETPTVIPTTVPTVAPSVEPTVTATPTPVLPTEEPVPTVAPTTTPIPTATVTPTVVPTVIPTAEPTATATPVPTATPMVTVEPTVMPTSTSTPVPTATATPIPTAVPTSTPKPTPVPTPVTAEPYLALVDESQTEIMISKEEVVEITVDTINYTAPCEEGYDIDFDYTVEGAGSLASIMHNTSGAVITQTIYRDFLRIIPLKNGEFDIHLNLVKENKEDKTDVEILQTITIHVTVNMVSLPDAAVPTTAPNPAYDPIANGYTEKIGEWQYGEDITATLWWNGEEDKETNSQVLVVEGKGRMWTTKEANVSLPPWKCEESKKGDYIHEVYIGEGITFVTGFRVTDNLRKVTLPSTLEEIDANAFRSCPKITEINLPEGLKIIGENAFENVDLHEIKLPSTLTYIGRTAFCCDSISYENHLTEVTIPAGVMYMEWGAFYRRTGLTITVEGQNHNSFADEWNSFYGAVMHEVVYK